MENKTKNIALYGVFSALLVVVFYLETLVTQAFTITPPAIVSLSLLFTLALYANWKTALASGVIFGVTSLVLAAIIGNPIFIMPWNSILPRLFVGIGAYGVFKLTKLLVKKSQNKFLNDILPYAVGAGAGIIINTSLVILCLTLFASSYGGFVYWVQACITINFPIELVCAIIFTPILSRVLLKYKNKNNIG